MGHSATAAERSVVLQKRVRGSQSKVHDALEAIVGVDAKTHDGCYFYRLIATERSPKLPAIQSGQHLCCHFGGTRLQDANIFQVPGGIKCADHHHPSAV